MASFCTNCGAPASGSFCIQCGSRITEAAPSAQPPPPPAPLKPSSGSGLKIVLIVLGVFFLIGALAVGGLVYAGYRAKQRIAELKREYLHESTTRNGRSHVSRLSSGACPALAADDAAHTLGVSIERTEFDRTGDTEKCRFYISAADRQRLAAEHRPPDPGAKDTEKLVADALSAVQKYAAAANDDGYSFSLDVVRSGGREKWQDIERTHSPGFALRRIDGIGDDAYLILGGQSVLVLKGDSMAVLSFRTFMPGVDRATALAKEAVASL